MSQSKQQWETSWNGHGIRVQTRADWLGHIETCVFIDGVLIQRHSGDFWNPYTPCAGEFEDETGTHRIQVKFGAASLKSVKCHILVNDKLVGGDISQKILLTQEETDALPVREQRKRLQRRNSRDGSFLSPS